MSRDRHGIKRLQPFIDSGQPFRVGEVREHIAGLSTDAYQLVAGRGKRQDNLLPEDDLREYSSHNNGIQLGILGHYGTFHSRMTRSKPP